MELDIYQVDAFTGKPFSGNPAGVCVLDGPADEGWMQSVAREMNIAETAFLYIQGEHYNLRSLTPAVEVDLCGHATLASAHVLWETGVLSRAGKAVFETKSGILTAVDTGDMIELDFPREEASEAPAPENLLEAISVKPLYIGKNRFDYLIELASEEEVRGLEPDFALLKKVPARGVIVTSVSESQEYDFVSRFFGPASGIDEDPATGSAHCCLGPYWQGRLGKREFNAYQASPRGGEIYVRMDGDDRVILGGRAVTVLKCELYSLFSSPLTGED